ncbi:MAG: endonuclease/exonuclease/phosphatase family protein [Bacteroidales bacterium]|nr:endonuclease/exonuclease/phosphatase family protein [Bacteroidales bacterium]
MGKHRSTSALILVNILLILNIMAVISILCSYGAQYIDPRDSWLFALFGLLYPWILIANVLFVILWLFLWKKYALISLIAILIGWKQLNAMITFHRERPILLPGPNLSIITWNLHGFAGQMNVRGNVRPEITEYLSSENQDILCLQEFYIHEAVSSPVINRMAREWGLPYYYVKDYYNTDPQDSFTGLATFSRLPIIRAGFLQQQPDKYFGIYTDIVLEYDTFRIFNIHLASLRLGQKDVSFYYKLKKTETENINLKAGLFSILRKVKQSFITRASETDKLLEAIRQSPYPVLVCGDLNDSPFSFTYRQLTRSLSDAFLDAGEDFFGSTYDGALPNYRIDYILYDSHFKAFSYKKSDVTFSDHYPVTGLIMVAY